jgi:multiple sugar transport system substrate-binding protein
VIELESIAWNHTRGFLPMVASAQRFSELHPEIAIRWQKRSLQEFADFPLNRLATKFDLLVIDYPSVGFAASHGIFAPFDDWLCSDFLVAQAANSVGASHNSYCYDGKQWALAIDAATPVSGCRPDLLEKAGAHLPQSWDELIHLAGRGLVVMPGVAVDTLMNLCTLRGFG